MITGFFNDSSRATKLFSSKKKPTAVEPAGQQPDRFEFDSKAYDTK
jgi:hypothetical protein